MSILDKLGQKSHYFGEASFKALDLLNISTIISVLSIEKGRSCLPKSDPLFYMGNFKSADMPHISTYC